MYLRSLEANQICFLNNVVDEIYAVVTEVVNVVAQCLFLTYTQKNPQNECTRLTFALLEPKRIPKTDAPAVGIEPTTTRLRVVRSTD